VVGGTISVRSSQDWVQYAQFAITGSLTLNQGASFLVDVNCTNLYQSDIVRANAVTLDTSVAFTVYDYGTSSTGMHTYNILTGVTGFAGAVGTSWTWLGDNLTPLNGGTWNYGVAGNFLRLTGLVG
jgi:hypothetical protein